MGGPIPRWGLRSQGKGRDGKGPGSSNPGFALQDRSTMIVLMPTSYEWFEEWQEEPNGKRSSDYETLKTTFVEASLSVVMKLFPQLKGKVGRPYGYGNSWCRFSLFFRAGKLNPEIAELPGRQGTHAGCQLIQREQKRRDEDLTRSHSHPVAAFFAS